MIEASGLTKRYGAALAVDGLSFTVLKVMAPIAYCLPSPRARFR
jgi:hypothetical protein